MKRLIIAGILILLCTALYSQSYKFNDGWEFIKVDAVTEYAAIENQGTRWEDQFNIQHLDHNAELSVPAETLQKEFQAIADGKWEPVSLPHTANIEPLVVLHEWQGVCYYRKTFDFPSVGEANQVWLEFEGAMHLADVWANGTHLLQHAGGYTPFVADLTGIIKAGTNEILVRLDNRDNPLIPPGKPVAKLDFSYYGGIYRDVNIIVKPPVHITNPILADEVAGGGIFVTYPEVGEQYSSVSLKTHVRNSSDKGEKIEVLHNLYEAHGLFTNIEKGKKAASCKRSMMLDAGEDIHNTQTILLQRPKLWSPDAPHLYFIETEIRVGGKTVDKEVTRIGIRRIEFSKDEGFKINGKPLRLVGSNRHMEYPYLGNAISDNAQYRDMYQIRESGFNTVRLGHYPQDPSVMDACDELGLLVIEPIPGWQFFNRSPLFTELTYRDVRDMIRRDRNHPSVIMWETTLNESWPPDEWKDGAVAAAHAEYPGDQCYTSGDGYGYDGFDVVYNDWQEGFLRPNPGTKAGFIREYYDFEFGGHYSSTRIIRGYGERALRQNAWNAQWSHNRYRKQYPWTAGDAVWSMYDYNRGCADNICYSGVADIFRLPKYSIPFFLSQISPGTPLPSGFHKPYLFIASQWTQREEEDDTVVVFGNVEEVELLVNGKSVARQNGDNGPDSEYVKHPDGGNCLNLDYPPFTFRGIKWESGEIKAIGYSGGEKVVEALVLTPGKAAGLKISYFESGRPASTCDDLIVYVSIVDQNGTLCFDDNESTVLLSAEGSAVVIPKEVTAEAGTASFIVKTGKDATITLRAGSANMRAEKELKLHTDN